jgi:hypothetical protein
LSVEPTKDALLVEYQAAQDSAEHHDNLVWTVTSTMWGASLILLGFTFGQIGKPGLGALIIIISFLGISLSVFVWIFALQLNNLKRQKYERCRELEEELGLLQHTNHSKHPRGSQRYLYAVIMALFIAAWCIVLWSAVRDS